MKADCYCQIAIICAGLCSTAHARISVIVVIIIVVVIGIIIIVVIGIIVTNITFLGTPQGTSGSAGAG